MKQMNPLRFMAIGLCAVASCIDGNASDVADDSATGTIDQELSASVTLGTTLVTTDNLNLRTGPSTSDSIIEVIPAGTAVSVVYHTSPTNGFYNILVGRHVGWSSGLYMNIGTPPNAKTLDDSIVGMIVEPPGSGNDDKGAYYDDRNYWNFCAPGSVSAGLAYFTSNPTNWSAGEFVEPYGPHTSKTYWTSADAWVGRAYLMYIAEQVKPPSFTKAGLPDFSTYPTNGSSLHDSRDVLNWEASGHDSSYSTFFYQDVSASGLTEATLHNDVTRDIFGGHGVLAHVDTAGLPNWGNKSVPHSILIIGYDDAAGTYAYIDTCGKRCNGTSYGANGGVWHVPQSKMFHAIEAHSVGYAR